MRKTTPLDGLVLFAVCMAGSFAGTLVADWYYPDSQYATLIGGLLTVGLIFAVGFLMFRKKAT